jgi:uncharacterized UBP type Zn finger protein
MLMSLLDNLRFAIQRRRGPGTKATRCGHLDQIRDVTRGSDGCEQCLALGDSWVHLRICMTCGQVGCCDSSKNKHAHRHADQIGHPIARSAEPGEDWMWCFIDSTMVQAARS